MFYLNKGSTKNKLHNLDIGREVNRVETSQSGSLHECLSKGCLAKKSNIIWKDTFMNNIN